MEPASPQRWHYLLAAGVAGIVVFFRLGAISLNTHECYLAIAAGHMADPDYRLDPTQWDSSLPPDTPANRWMIPAYNGRPRLEKAPLAYWTAAGLLAAGAPRAEWVFRLTSAVAWIGMVLLTLWLGRRAVGRPAALWGSLILATSWAALTWGRDARPDVLMCLWTTAAMAAAWGAAHARTDSGRWTWLLATGGALALANLAKQFAPMAVVLPLLAYLCWRAERDSGRGRERRRLAIYLVATFAASAAFLWLAYTPAMRSWARFGLSQTAGRAATFTLLLGTPLAWLAAGGRVWRRLRLQPLLGAVACGMLALAPLALWMAFVRWQIPSAGEVFNEQTVQRALGEGGWTARMASPLTGFYAVALGEFALPWVLLLPGALAMPWLSRFAAARDGLVFLACWTLLMMAQFSGAVGKFDHYILPALPAACLLMGCCARDLFGEHRWLPRWACLAVAICTASTVSVGLPWLLRAEGVVSPRMTAADFATAAAAAAVLLLAWAAVVLAARRRAAAGLALLVVGAAVGHAAVWMQAPRVDEDRELAAVARAAAARVGPEAPVASWNALDSVFLYYFGRDVPEAMRYHNYLIREHGKVGADRSWNDWLADRGRVPWMITRDIDNNREAMEERGFAAVEGLPTTSNPRERTILMYHVGRSGRRSASRPAESTP